MTRRQAREIIFSLVYEVEFHKDTPYTEIYNETIGDYAEDGVEGRVFEENSYVRQVFFGMEEKLPEIDALIAGHAVGWKVDRLSKVSHAIMRVCVYEMLYSDDVPANVAINEALELAKIYDHDNAPAFINGVVNAIAKDKGLLSDNG
ncbi:MAG: transcription antitermination factor NusB [Clostridia bacterium]|nr:transcription antitermination factor NusB [Clostridia bacterium]